jgi:hypothetical protein
MTHLDPDRGTNAHRRMRHLGNHKRSVSASKLYTYTRVDEWEDFVELASMPWDGEADTVTENTILVMNAGAHVRSPVNHRLYSLTPSAISGLDIRSRCFRTVRR